MNEGQDLLSLQMRKWATRAAFLVMGMFIGLMLAIPDRNSVADAKRITAKEQSIYGAAVKRRNAALDELAKLEDAHDALRENIRDDQKMWTADELRAERRLSKLKRQISGAKRTLAKRSFEGEGTYLVGDDIEPGTYKANASEGCYWARHSAGDSLDSIIENNNQDGPVVITVAPSDHSVEVTRCGTFRRQ